MKNPVRHITFRNIIFLFLFFSLPASAQDVQKPFTIILLPDTQDCIARKSEVFASQIDWILNNIAPLNIVQVIHLGDVTDGNSEKEWNAAANIMSRLDGKVPYSIAAGNHDLDHRSPRDPVLYNRFFPVTDFEKKEGWGGTYMPGHLENSYSFFNAGGKRYMVLTLEFGPRAEVVYWAHALVKRHPDCEVIINTHCFVYDDNTRVDRHDRWNPHGYSWIDSSPAGSTKNAHDGDELWKALVYNNPNIFLVVSGHVKGSGTGRLVSRGISGTPIFQLLANYQYGVTGTGGGTTGYLRILTFDPAKKRVTVRTWSPYLDRFNLSPSHEFGMDLPAGTFFSVEGK